MLDAMQVKQIPVRTNIDDWQTAGQTLHDLRMRRAKTRTGSKRRKQVQRSERSILK